MVGGWSYDVDGSVAIWDLRTWYDPDLDEVEDLMETFRTVTGNPQVTASVVLLGEGGFIDRAALDLLESDLDLYEENDVERVAFVSPDIKGLALEDVVSQAPGVETKTTDDRADAFEWARA